MLKQTQVGLHVTPTSFISETEVIGFDNSPDFLATVADADLSPGEQWIVNSPVNTVYEQSNSTLWRKTLTWYDTDVGGNDVRRNVWTQISTVNGLGEISIDRIPRMNDDRTGFIDSNISEVTVDDVSTVYVDASNVEVKTLTATNGAIKLADTTLTSGATLIAKFADENLGGDLLVGTASCN